MMDRPALRCIIAKPLSDTRIGRTRVVSLGVAFLAVKAGWIAVGPDPEDEQNPRRVGARAGVDQQAEVAA